MLVAHDLQVLFDEYLDTTGIKHERRQRDPKTREFEPRTYSADASVDHTSTTPKRATTSLAASVHPTTHAADRQSSLEVRLRGPQSIMVRRVEAVISTLILKAQAPV